MQTLSKMTNLLYEYGLNGGGNIHITVSTTQQEDLQGYKKD